MSNPYKNIDLKKYLASFTPVEIEEKNRIQDEENAKVYSEFIAALKLNKCFMCGMGLNEFDENEFCFHWFLHPQGIRKRHFDNYLNNNELRFFNLDSYLRWLANTEKPFRNINDLTEEIASNQLFQYTIKYKNIEWSISVGHTDIAGHKNKKIGSAPHYHLQMKVNGLIFIRFNDYHIRFSDEDLFMLELIRQSEGDVGIGHFKGQGISVLETHANLKILDEKMKLVDNESSATFLTQTFIQAPEGESISGELIAELLEESKKTKIPFRHLFKRHRPDYKITTIVNPGEGVPEMKKRKGRGKSKKA